MTESGALIFVRLTPNAARDEIKGVWTGPDGARRLALRVGAPPDKGRANASAITLLAKCLGAPKSCFSIVAGETDRLKTIAAQGEPAALYAKVMALAGVQS